MDERGDGDGHEDARPSGPAPDDPREAAGHAARERHVRTARRFFEAVPPYRAQFERDGTVSLHFKEYRYWPDRAPADATQWNPISIHHSLEQAERRRWSGDGLLRKLPLAPAPVRR